MKLRRLSPDPPAAASIDHEDSSRTGDAVSYPFTASPAPAPRYACVRCGRYQPLERLALLAPPFVCADEKSCRRRAERRARALAEPEALLPVVRVAPALTGPGAKVPVKGDPSSGSASADALFALGVELAHEQWSRRA